MTGEPVRVGVIGCGNISDIYLSNARKLPPIEIVACADLVASRAAEKARQHGVPRACSVDELLADPNIQAVLNLTVPAAHAEVAVAALRAGKSVYNEKPLAITREDGQQILTEARQRGLRVGCAPDTFLGAGWQTVRHLIDEGVIGRPVAATAFMVCHGHEGWHPAPEFYYQPGGGPMFDMGPYYLTALVHLLGPVRRVCGFSRISFPQRTITSEPLRGRTIDVRTPTHVAGTLDFVDGALATIITSFDIWHAHLPLLEIHGAEGSLSAPDPNAFGGPVHVRRAADAAWNEVPLRPGYAENSRGLGLADMVRAWRRGRPHRASAEMAWHVLDIMHALEESSQQGRAVTLASTCSRPAPLPSAAVSGDFDD
ncbi:MAG: Gfo/Idh/MocA family oxidoreductase [Phycisphaerae bacterium]